MKLTNTVVEEIAGKVGFNLVGFAPADQLLNESESLGKWLADGYQAGMKYMERNSEKRNDVSQVLPERGSQRLHQGR